MSTILRLCITEVRLIMILYDFVEHFYLQSCH